jgi:hypothetical protein
VATVALVQQTCQAAAVAAGLVAGMGDLLYRLIVFILAAVAAVAGTWVAELGDQRWVQELPVFYWVVVEAVAATKLSLGRQLVQGALQQRLPAALLQLEAEVVAGAWRVGTPQLLRQLREVLERLDLGLEIISVAAEEAAAVSSSWAQPVAMGEQGQALEEVGEAAKSL